MLDRECAGDTVGNRLFIREVLRQSAVGKCSYRVVGVSDIPRNGAMRVELVGGLPDRPDRQNDDFPTAFAQRCVFLLGDRKVEEGGRDVRRQQSRIEWSNEPARFGAGLEI